MIKAVIFDMDNTLVHRERSIEKFSCYFEEKYRDSLVNETKAHIALIIKTTDNGGYGNANNPHPKIKQSITIRLCQELNWSSAPQHDEILNCWVTHFSACSVAMPGALETLQWLQQNSIKLAVVSNGAEATRLATLKQLGLLPLMETVLSSGAFGVKKPDPRIFNAVLSALSCSSANSVFVGDHPMLDVNGARQAGMQTVWVQGFHTWPEQLAPPDVSITELTELKSVLTRFLPNSPE